MAHPTPPSLQSGPGALGFSAALSQHLASSLAAKGCSYQARTKHLDARGRPRFINRLLLEMSPYLQQHAHNPVDWFPWGDEAFALAKALGRPVLLSIGYSTCHWCHVMEEESFEDLELAELINGRYLAIKVDREERPDIDAAYMACVQVWTGRGGWPMTVWLGADKRPYFGGTYFPARGGDRGSRIGLHRLLVELGELYREAPQQTERTAARVLAEVERRAAPGPTPRPTPSDELLHRAFRYVHQRFDLQHGGRRGAPKFPAALQVRFLLRYAQRYGGDAQAMADLTLKTMAAGGMRDHLAGGFHRYSVDDEWLMPHFEKMLYDNARLAATYTEAWQLTKDPDYAIVAKSTLDYVRHEMTAEHGGFFAATDADSVNPHTGRRVEGWVYTWSQGELQEVLGTDLARIARCYFGVQDERSVLHTPLTLQHAALELGLNASALSALIDQIRQLLYHERRKRPQPLRDDKVIAGWNGLMISAFAKGAQAFQVASYLDAATRAAVFVSTQLMPGGRLQRSYLGRVGSSGAFLEDYACVIQGLLDLYAASAEPRWLALSETLTATVIEDFAAASGFYTTSKDSELLLRRERLGCDGALPAAHSVLALNFARLATLTGRSSYRQQAEEVIAAAQPVLAQAPAALPEMLLAVDYLLPATAHKKPLRDTIGPLPVRTSAGLPASDALSCPRYPSSLSTKGTCQP